MLLWMLEWGEAVPAMERAAARGQSTPALDSRPAIWAHLESVLDCFRACSKRRADRSSAIPITEIVAWLDLHRISSVERRASYFSLVDAMDDAFLSHIAKKGG